jgi:hypothetical protein
MDDGSDIESEGFNTAFAGGCIGEAVAEDKKVDGD